MKALISPVDAGEAVIAAREFCAPAHTVGPTTALAGSVHTRHLAALAGIGVDVVGGRGAVCGGNDRSTGIDLREAETYMAEARQLDGPAQAVERGARRP